MPNQTVLELDQVNFTYQFNPLRPTSFREYIASRFSKDEVQSWQNSQIQEVNAADHISFRVSQGDRIGIIGKNGAGKSTLCRLVSGIYKPDSGHIQLNGHVRLVMDTGVGIYPDLSGRENAEFLSHFLFAQSEKRQVLVNEAIEWSELGKFIDAPVRSYSKGMLTRLILSLVSAAPTDLLILDEVFDGADRFFSEKTLPRFLNTIEKSGAVLFVSHSEDQIKKICNRVIVLDQGKLIFDGGVVEGIKKYSELG